MPDTETKPWTTPTQGKHPEPPSALEAASLCQRPSEHVRLDTRYSGAWNEINARLQLRQALILYYTSMTIPLIGWLGYENHARDYWYLAYFFPVIAIVVTELLAVLERMIGNPHFYCKHCETLGDPDREIPSYHAQAQPSSIDIPRTRRAQHLVIVSLILVSNFIAFILTFKEGLMRIKGSDWIFPILVITSPILYWGFTFWTLWRIWGLHWARLEIDRKPRAPLDMITQD
jgi:hypothetical protein